MDLPEIADIVLSNLHLEQSFKCRMVCSGWNFGFRQSNRRPTDDDWKNICNLDNVALMRYLLLKYPSELTNAIRILYRGRYDSPKIFEYFVMNHPNELLSGAVEHCSNFIKIVNRYQIVRELFVGLLLMTYLSNGEYGYPEFLFRGVEESDLMEFFEHLVSIGYTENHLLDIIKFRVTVNPSSLFLNLHHQGIQYKSANTEAIDKHKRAYTDVEIICRLRSIYLKSKIPALRSLRI